MSDTSGPPQDPHQQPWGQPQQPSGAWAGGASPPQGYAPPPRKRRKWPWVLLVVVILFAGGCAAIIASISHEATKTVKVKYEVTGDARNVTVTYSTWNDGNIATSQENVAQLPWTKELKTKGFTRGGSLVVSLGAAGGSVSCSVTVDKDTPRTAQATGPFATATCSDF
jgi:hypothetical protein